MLLASLFPVRFLLEIPDCIQRTDEALVFSHEVFILYVLEAVFKVWYFKFSLKLDDVLTYFNIITHLHYSILGLFD